jgi:hypothetical protein
VRLASITRKFDALACVLVEDFVLERHVRGSRPLVRAERSTIDVVGGSSAIAAAYSNPLANLVK